MKIKEFQNYLRKNKIGYAILLNTTYSKKDPNFFYFAQTDIDFGVLVVPAKGKPTIFIPGFEYERVKGLTKLRVKRPTSTFKDIKKRCHVANIEEIRENEFNLNVPRYVNISDPEEIINIQETIDELKKIEKEKEKLNKKLEEDLKQLGITF